MKAPMPGAARITRLAPSEVDDAFEHVARALRNRGWTVLDEECSIKPVGPHGRYVMVTAWAVPPRGGDDDRA